jgi:hypothetical protein
MAARSARSRYILALDALLKGRMARLVIERDFELLKEVARLAQTDAPKELAVSDPALFSGWRAAVTRYHLAGWTNMTPNRVEEVAREFAADSPAPPEGEEDPAGAAKVKSGA